MAAMYFCQIMTRWGNFVEGLKNIKVLFMINLIYQRIMLDQERSQTNQETLSDVLIAIKRLRIEHA
jgi:hypothetical protein